MGVTKSKVEIEISAFKNTGVFRSLLRSKGCTQAVLPGLGWKGCRCRLLQCHRPHTQHAHYIFITVMLIKCTHLSFNGIKLRICCWFLKFSEGKKNVYYAVPFSVRVTQNENSMYSQYDQLGE